MRREEKGKSSSVLNVRIAANLKVDLEVAVARSRSSLQAAVTEAIAAWLAAQAGGKINVLTPDQLSEVVAFIDLLRTGSEEDLRKIAPVLAKSRSEGRAEVEEDRTQHKAGVA